MTLDTAKLGMWSGGLIVLNAQTSFGKSLFGDTGSLSPVNYLSLFPEPGKDSTVLMEYYLTQALPGNSALVVGRIDATNFLDRNKFANNPRNQFLNLSLGNDPLVGAFPSYSTYGVLWTQPMGEHFRLSLSVYDASIQPGDYSGNDSGGLFHDVGPAFDVDVTWKIASDLDGSVDVNWLWTNREPTDISNQRLLLKDILTGQPLPKKSSNHFVGVNIWQYVWKPDGATKPERTAEYAFQERGLGVFFRAGWTPEDRNPYNVFLSGGVGGRGIIEGRPFDRFGIGVFWLKESSDLDNQRVNLLRNEFGVEAFYNVALTPWLNLTPDVQWIRSGVNRTDDQLVLGGRLNMRF